MCAKQLRSCTWRSICFRAGNISILGAASSRKIVRDGLNRRFSGVLHPVVRAATLLWRVYYCMAVHAFVVYFIRDSEGEARGICLHTHHRRLQFRRKIPAPDGNASAIHC